MEADSFIKKLGQNYFKKKVDEIKEILYKIRIQVIIDRFSKEFAVKSEVINLFFTNILIES